MNKIILSTMVIVLCIASTSFADECKFIVKDTRNNPVQFILKPQEIEEGGKILESDENGKLKISHDDLSKYSKKRYQLEFVNKLAELIYEKRLIDKKQKSKTPPLALDGYYFLYDLCEGSCREFIVPDLKRGKKPKL